MFVLTVREPTSLGLSAAYDLPAIDSLMPVQKSYVEEHCAYRKEIQLTDKIEFRQTINADTAVIHELQTVSLPRMFPDISPLFCTQVRKYS